MYLVQFLLPLASNDGRPLAPALFVETERELTEAFGGVTAHVRAPARGRWRDGGEGLAGAPVVTDDVVLFEVLAETLDRAWWAAYRARLEARFVQEEVLVRAIAAERL